jgi:hypothetical protein
MSMTVGRWWGLTCIGGEGMTGNQTRLTVATRPHRTTGETRPSPVQQRTRYGAACASYAAGRGTPGRRGVAPRDDLA